MSSFVKARRAMVICSRDPPEKGVSKLRFLFGSQFFWVGRFCVRISLCHGDLPFLIAGRLGSKSRPATVFRCFSLDRVCEFLTLKSRRAVGNCSAEQNQGDALNPVLPSGFARVFGVVFNAYKCVVFLAPWVSGRRVFSFLEMSFWPQRRACFWCACVLRREMPWGQKRNLRGTASEMRSFGVRMSVRAGYSIG